MIIRQLIADRIMYLLRWYMLNSMNTDSSVLQYVIGVRNYQTRDPASSPLFDQLFQCPLTSVVTTDTGLNLSYVCDISPNYNLGWNTGQMEDYQWGFVMFMVDWLSF